MNNTNDFDEIIEGINILIDMYLQQNPRATGHECRRYLFNICPSYKKDNLFISMFPVLWKYKCVPIFKYNPVSK
jgi:hypothetical protein